MPPPPKCTLFLIWGDGKVYWGANGAVRVVVRVVVRVAVRVAVRGVFR
jgi:hypothetical protein